MYACDFFLHNQVTRVMRPTGRTIKNPPGGHPPGGFDSKPGAANCLEVDGQLVHQEPIVGGAG